MGFSLTADAIFVPCYALRPGGELTAVNRRSVEIAIRLYHEGRAPVIILSHGYGLFWQREMECKLALLAAGGIPETACVHIWPLPDEKMTNTFIEFERLASVITSAHIRTMIVVVERWHSIRFRRWLTIALPEITFFEEVFRERYERHLSEPRWKGFSTIPVIWPVWNVFFFLLTPFLVRQVR